MLKELLYPLTEYFSFFNVFQYITFRGAYAAVTSLILTFILGPPFIRYMRERKAGQSIREDGPETHQVKSGTPTMGGVLIVASVFISIFVWQDITNPYTWISIIALLGFGAIGFVDDYLKVYKRDAQGLQARFKIFGQIGVSTAIVLILFFTKHEYTTLLYLPFFKYPLLDLSYLYIPFGILLLVGTSNAVNLTDGLDGLATGLVLFVSITFAILSYLAERVDFAEYLQIPYLPETGELTVLCLAVAGSCLGFLWYNSHPAEIMMGDTGSLSLGGVIGVVALMIKKELLLFIVGGVFVLETFSVIIQVISYRYRKKRVFKMAPLHHHFELKGWAESKVVIRLWILGGLFAILGISTLKLQ